MTRPAEEQKDYQRIAQAIEYLVAEADTQPSLEQLAAHLELSPHHFQRLFSRWAGLSPKRFLQVLTLERAKLLLDDHQPLLSVSEEVGLSSGSRLYDHFIQLEAMTPGEYRHGGAGLTIRFGLHPSPFGEVMLAITDKGICALRFTEEEQPDAVMHKLAKQWPGARFVPDQAATLPMVNRCFSPSGQTPGKPLSLHVSGTNFQVNVWRALLQIPTNRFASYGQIAAAVDRPGSSRAVGQAVGANPVGVLIPCHRVIQQTGAIGGYRWGPIRKRAILAWEAGASAV